MNFIRSNYECERESFHYSFISNNPDHSPPSRDSVNLYASCIFLEHCKCRKKPSDGTKLKKTVGKLLQFEQNYWINSGITGIIWPPAMILNFCNLRMQKVQIEDSSNFKNFVALFACENGTNSIFLRGCKRAHMDPTQ